jgi:hypothetical protein
MRKTWTRGRIYAFQMGEECEVVDIRIKRTEWVNEYLCSIDLQRSNVAKHLFYFHDKYVVVPADMPRTSILIC